MAIKTVVTRGFVFADGHPAIRGFFAGEAPEDTTPVFRYRDATSGTFRSRDAATTSPVRYRDQATTSFRPR